jgi:uroporphyrinogen decarboxylase
MDKIIPLIGEYLWAQRQAGADVLMLFDSWAGELPYDLIDSCCIDPHEKILAFLREKDPHIPVICFPRNLSLRALERFQKQVVPSALALSNKHSPWEYHEVFPPLQVLQLGPDPVSLKIGGDALYRAAEDVLKAFKSRPYIMNLAHGVLPSTPLDHVRAFIHQVREFKS